MKKSNLERAVAAVADRIKRLAGVPCTSDTRAELAELLAQAAKLPEAAVIEFNETRLAGCCEHHILENKLKALVAKYQPPPTPADSEKILSSLREICNNTPTL